MRNIALSLSLLGIGLLFFIMQFSDIRIYSSEDVKTALPNQKVIVKGIVTSQTSYFGNQIIYIGNLSVVCKCNLDLVGKNVILEGYVDEYNGKRTIEVLSVDLIK